jgi:hypothetical protein
MRKAATIQNFGQSQGESVRSVQFEETCPECSITDPRHLAAAKLEARINDYLALAAHEELFTKLRQAQLRLIYDDLNSFQMTAISNDLEQTYEAALLARQRAETSRTRLGRTLDLIVGWFGV